jgi:hypothetical protein
MIPERGTRAIPTGLKERREGEGILQIRREEKRKKARQTKSRPRTSTQGKER